MSESNRGERARKIEVLFCAVALFGTVILAYSIGQNVGIGAGRNEVAAREHYERDKERSLQACINIVGKDAVQCAAKAIESAQEKSETRQDLFAQQDAARWGFGAMMIAAGSTLITAFGTALLYQQIILTRKAVEDTGLATQAMHDANEISRQTQEYQLRAYLSVHEAIPKFKNGENINIRFLIKNVGQTPAKIKSLKTASFQGLYRDFFDKGIIGSINWFEQKVIPNVMPNESRKVFCGVSGDEASAFFGVKNSCVFFAIAIVYLDFFGNERSLNACYWMSGNSYDHSEALHTYFWGNDFT